MEVPASLAGRRIRPADYLGMEVAGLSPAAVSSVLDNCYLLPTGTVYRVYGVTVAVAPRAAASRVT